MSGAAWRRAWQCYDVNMTLWPQAKNNGLLKSMGLDPVELAYWTSLYDRTHAGEINTWDYQWGFTCWQHQGLGVTPNVNLVTNIGASPDATHTKMPEGSLAIATGNLNDLTHPAHVSRDVEADQYTFDEHYGGRVLRRKPGLKQRVRQLRRKIKKQLQGLIPFSKFGDK